MDAEQRETILARLRRIEGQVRGLQRMIQEGEECNQLMTQLSAARGGLEQVSLLLMDTHVKDCVLRDSPLSPETIAELQQTLRIWARFGAPASQLP